MNQLIQELKRQIVCTRPISRPAVLIPTPLERGLVAAALGQVWPHAAFATLGEKQKASPCPRERVQSSLDVGRYSGGPGDRLPCARKAGKASAVKPYRQGVERGYQDVKPQVELLTAYQIRVLHISLSDVRLRLRSCAIRTSRNAATSMTRQQRRRPRR